MALLPREFSQRVELVLSDFFYVFSGVKVLFIVVEWEMATVGVTTVGGVVSVSELVIVTVAVRPVAVGNTLIDEQVTVTASY